VSTSLSTERSGTTRYGTRIRRSVDELSPETAGLATAAGASEFYYGHEFLRAYENEPIQPVHDVYYIEVVDDHGAPIALTPCYVQGDPLRALGLRDGELALLSHVWHCSDTQLASTRTTPDVAATIAEAMRGIAAAAGLSRFGFINVAAGSPSAEALAAAGLPGIDLDTRYVMDLAGLGDWEGYLAALRPSARHEYRRQLRRADDAGVAIVHRAPGSPEDPESLQIFETLMERVGSAGYYSKERISAFLTYTPSCARMIEVVLDGTLLAKAIVMVESRKIHAWAGGYDRDRDERADLPFSSYYVLMAAIMKLGFSLGVPILEGGRRNAAFKTRFGMTPLTTRAYVADA
jgi:Acetyltransferase (GNAT) domain